PTDCMGQDTECQQRKCDATVCSTTKTAAGIELTVQTAGDCKIAQCNGVGGIQNAIDDTDLPVDGKQCTFDLCTNGMPSNPPLPPGEPCSEGTSPYCDGSGNCVACLGPADCTGVDTECQHRACIAGTCAMTFSANGTPVSVQTGGDCNTNVCDGAGNVITITD